MPGVSMSLASDEDGRRGSVTRNQPASVQSPEVPKDDNKEARMVSQDIPEFMPGDIILCPGKHVLPHILTRWATQSRDESPTYAVHTAQFLSAHKIIEMQAVVKKRSIKEFLQMRTAFEMWRLNSLTLAQRQAISRKSLEYVGRKFGWSKLFTHLLDAVVNKVVHKEIFFFRKLNHDQRYPICSWITTFSYDRALDYRFGVPPECADPDQIHDWVSSHPDEWERIFSLEESASASPLDQPHSAVHSSARALGFQHRRIGPARRVHA